ncbi:MAG: SdiA-regulated domain-containing protein [Pseudomonadales bacterium]
MSYSKAPLTCLLAGLVLACVACEPEAQLSEQSAAKQSDEILPLLRLKLPPLLQEVSGLSTTPEGNILAVGDEQAVIFEIDLASTEVVKRTGLGQSTLLGDFEGIEQVGNEVFLVDSDGDLLSYDVLESTEVKRVETKVGKRCEVEGLGYDPVEDLLYLLCKQRRSKKLPKHKISLFAFSLADRRLQDSANLLLDGPAAAAELGIKKLSPSALAFSPSGEQLTVIAAKQNAVATFTRDGQLIRAEHLPEAGKHQQVEGLAIMTDGRWVLADEGGAGAGKLSVYAHEL